MKKTTTLKITIGLIVFLFAFSCSDKVHTTAPSPESPLIHLPLLIVEYPILEAESSFDGVALEGMDSGRSYITFKKNINWLPLVGLICQTTWEETTYTIHIPAIFLEGEPTHITFDDTSDETTITVNSGKEHISIHSTVSGWIEPRLKETLKTSTTTRSGYRGPEVLCEINISCIVEGKTLNLKITSIEPLKNPA